MCGLSSSQHTVLFARRISCVYSTAVKVRWDCALNLSSLLAEDYSVAETVAVGLWSNRSHPPNSGGMIVSTKNKTVIVAKLRGRRWCPSEQRVDWDVGVVEGTL